MRLTVLGCAGTFPGPHSGCSAYLIEHDGYRLCLDFGTGAVGALQRHGDVLALDSILVSHLHADHCIDLVGYYYARRYHPSGQAPPIPVYGPAGTRERVCGAFEHNPGKAIESVYEFHVTAPGSLTLGPFTIDLVAMYHPIESHAMRLTAGGRTLVYSSDTAPYDPLVELARGADLFLCEASWLDSTPNPPGVHMSAREAAETAAKAGVSRLMLTHVVPWVDSADSLTEASAVFDGELLLAERDASYEV